MTDWSSVPGRDWEWDEGSHRCGVHTHEGQLVWWSRPFGPTGYMFEGACVQTFDDFLTSGPPVSAPTEVVAELQTLLVRRNSNQEAT
jgi:hypothetical protein